MIAVDAQSIALFFFFTFMDERMAFSSASKAIKVFRKNIAKHPEVPSQIALIRSVIKIWNLEKDNISKGRQATAFSKEWTLPKGLDLNPWKEFQKNSTDEELIAIVLVKILKFKSADVAMAINLSEGTIQYRLAKALVRLGKYSENPFAPIQKKGRLGLVR